MFYVLYFQFTGTLESLKKQLSDLFAGDIEIRITDNELLVINDWATLRFSIHGVKIDFAKEDYGLPFNACAWIDIMNSHSAWSSRMLEFIDEMLEVFTGACTLEANGEKPILIRNKEGLFVDRNLGGSEPMPFELLRHPWTEVTLVRPDNS